MAKKEKIVAFQAPKGMRDILPPEQPLWDRMRKTLKDVADFYNFQRIDTPIVERADLFERSVGAATDVVEKQMFRLEAKEGALALRPEGTAPVARAYLEHGMSHWAQPLKLWYEGSMFRYEQPQAGRLREFHQAGFEILSVEDDPCYDAQIILASYRFLEGLKLKDAAVAVNTIGCRTCRPPYREELREYYKDKTKLLCEDCVRRFKANPLRLLDCKEPGCEEVKREAPVIIDHLCRYCHDHYKLMLEYLEELSIPYTLDHYLVRGFDYYTRTVFEITVEGVPFSLGGGGRYNYLIELLGGRSTPAVGVALGCERIIEALAAQGIQFPAKAKPKVFLVVIGGLAKKKGLSLIEQFRAAGLDIAESLGKESLKAQLRTADKLGSSLALIFGHKEAFEEIIIIRDLKTGAQETAPLKKIVETIRRRLKAS